MKAMQSLGLSKSKQKGFTLVEIAIVLVIIGLLLGGVLKGQSLINSARVRTIADMNSSVQAAYYGFIDRYRAVPGDMDALAACNAIGFNQLNLAVCPAAGAAGGGNGDGRLDQGNFAEAAAVWDHLSGANFIVGDYIGTAANAAAYVVNTVAPPNPFGRPVLLGRTNQYEGPRTVRLGFYTGNGAPVNILSELDTKVDDGRPTTGVLRATQPAADYGAIAARAPTCADVPNNLWSVAVDDQDCNAIYLY